MMKSERNTQKKKGCRQVSQSVIGSVVVRSTASVSAAALEPSIATDHSAAAGTGMYDILAVINDTRYPRAQHAPAHVNQSINILTPHPQYHVIVSSPFPEVDRNRIFQFRP